MCCTTVMLVVRYDEFTSESNISRMSSYRQHGQDVVGNLDPLALIVFIPICDFLVYPELRRLKVNFNPMKRITAGFFTGVTAMVWVAVVEAYIYWQSEYAYTSTVGRRRASRCPPRSARSSRPSRRPSTPSARRPRTCGS